MPPARPRAAAAEIAALPRWSVALRAIREARGVSQAGWAARLGRSRNTVQRWESGGAVPDREAEAAIVDYCREHALFNLPLGGPPLSAAGLRTLFAAARLHDVAVPVAEQPAEQPVPPTNLPCALSSLVAREREVEAVCRTIEHGARLVTLCGPGGVGKTRLALAAGQALLPTYADGVWLVDLAPLAAPAIVADAVAAAIGVRETPMQPVGVTLVEALRQRRLLLILDNCEHLLEPCARLAEALLGACAGLALLCTSREPLRLAGELVRPVAPLAVPPLLPARSPEHAALTSLASGLAPGATEDEIASLQQYGAVQLFAERARAVAPGFALTAANVAEVTQICRRLDGLPLAIELAAARADTLSMQEIAAGLDERFALLTCGRRTAPLRHRTLRAAIDASVSLLSPPEAELFATLAVFAGSFALAAIAAVAGPYLSDAAAGGAIAAPAPENGAVAGPCLEIVAALVGKSLLVREEVEGRSRYRLLETVREYARELLQRSEHGEEAEARHRDWYLSLAERLELATWGGARQTSAIRTLEAEHDNLRAALTWSLRHQQATRALRLAGALGRFWEVRGHLREGRNWLETALAADAGVPAIVRGRALNAAGRLAMSQHDLPTAEAWLTTALEIFHALNVPLGIATTLMAAGTTALYAGDYATAVARHQEALSRYRALGNELGVAANLLNLGSDAYHLGDAAGATAKLDEALALFERLGYRRGAALAHTHLAAVASAGRDEQAVRSHLERALALARAVGDQPSVARRLQELGELARSRRDRAAAAAFYRECLPLLHELGDLQAVHACREALVQLVTGATPERPAPYPRDRA